MTEGNKPGRLRELAIALNAAPGIRLPSLCRLAGETETWLAAGSAGDRDRAARRLGVPRAQIDRARAFLPRVEATADRELGRAREMGARLVTRFDEHYPQSLLDLTLPPPVLYVHGELPTAPAVAIVGSRAVTPYGRESADLYSRALAATGVCIVSGLAVGADAAAHRGALAAGGKTVAVLGCGLGVDYPRPNRRLRKEISEQGAVISEFRFDTLPQAWRFPVRNRLIAALSLGTLVVQARPRSGSLITARLAMELGRDVFAIPGRIFDESALGPNALIRDGALLAQHPRDIIEALPYRAQAELSGTVAATEKERQGSLTQTGKEKLPQPQDRFARSLLQALPPAVSRSPEDLASSLGVAVDKVLAALLELELTGWARRMPGPQYRRNG